MQRGDVTTGGATMAIKFVDKDPGDHAKPKRAPSVRAEPDADALKQSVESELSHPKPEPKKRGRK